MFNWFGKKETGVPVKELTYMYTSAKWQGAAGLLTLHPNALVVAWFPDTQARFQQFAQQQGIPLPPIHIARQVTSMQVANKTVIFLEHYPLAGNETRLMESWKAATIFVLNALDEPLFIHFGGDRIAGLVKQMGMKEDEPLEHALITRSIGNARQQLAKKVMVEHSALSQQEWFRKNVSTK